MKTLITQKREQGSAVMIVLTMVGIMLIFCAVNTVAIRGVQKELRLVEKRQVTRLKSEQSGQPQTPARNPAHGQDQNH